MDLGCYCVHMARTIVGGDPRVVSAAAVERVRRSYRLWAGNPAMNPDSLRQPGQQSPSEGYCPGDGFLVQDPEAQRRVPEGQMVLECPRQPRLVDDHAARRYDVRADGAACDQRADQHRQLPGSRDDHRIGEGGALACGGEDGGSPRRPVIDRGLVIDGSRQLLGIRHAERSLERAQQAVVGATLVVRGQCRPGGLANDGRRASLVAEDPPPAAGLQGVAGASSAMPIEPVPATMPMPGTGLATRRS